MAENINKGLGQGNAYKFDKGGTVVTPGPLVGVVKNNIDPTRSGRIQVYLETYGGDPEDSSAWRTLNYMSPYLGITNQNNKSYGTAETGDFYNRQSYGMWFTAPDLGTKVLCFFANGDPNQGYYLGSIMEPGIGHMIPAIGASTNYVKDSGIGASITAARLPVTEINSKSTDISEDPQFFNRQKPIHSAVFSQLFFQQGLQNDQIRGVIGSNSQRESPSHVFGFSTPGEPIYADANKVNVLGRKGGHSFVMDDGDSNGNDQLVRIRTAAGHQITLSDSGESISIHHSNGESWIELGKEGTLDVYSTNSVNVRTRGTINLHADKDINMHAGGSINMLSNQYIKQESTYISQRASAELKLYSKLKLVARSDNLLAIDAQELGSFDGGKNMVLHADCISLNSGAGVPVSAATSIRKNQVADVTSFGDQGWQATARALETITTRAPTHEPWPYHGLGTQNSIDYSPPSSTSLPTATQTAFESASALAPDGITIDEFALQNRATLEVGTMNTDQVTGIMGQLAKETAQRYEDFSVDTGVGRYGLSPQQLEDAGYLVPGTVQTYLSNPSNTENILRRTEVWSEKDSVSDLASFLTSKSAQDSAVQGVLNSSFSQLRTNGVITGTESATDIGGILTGAVRYGASNTVKWAKGYDLNSVTKNGISQSVRNGQYAVTFVDEKVSDTLSAYGNPGASSNTVNTDAIKQAQAMIVKDPNITG